ncbi:Putative zn(2)-C6 fungal-type DNA-binding domain-containing protein [Septoria linicola]|uniref:Zn(2)-C6 fungal-type DNA-binding domain-containing protein n=1 Tax=Septoria linicola TaxID=215465 RepID=A0A9Q9AQL1_9PEZI|nr:putative zn(2)-C6 fungal-type DNA-binding domain-containing protein [Septoria linicola]USW50413.1 Putative zn(2)-C6 fungal-type DNA-binding domain-containing protein [Septoria linicola]
METGTTPTITAVTDSTAAAKRKRSPSASSVSAPVAKAAKTSSQMSINYLARQSQDDLPLISKDDTLPNLIHLLSAYSNILDRHESLASNLGARPLGPILIKRFERCFDSPPKIVASHHKNASGDPAETSHTITWLEVIEFARAHPAQFTLSTFSEGRRVCQFYYPQKQLRVQISEEDFLFINSGRCQELIPPLPIWEDEEKEVGTCDVLEAKLKELTNAADMVAARTRQLSHRLKGRRVAILERRAEGGSGTPAKANAPQTTTAHPSTSGSGFNAVNASITNGRPVTEHVEPILGSNAAVRTELLRHFESLPHNQGPPKLHARHHSTTVGFDAAQQTPKTTDFTGLTQNDGAMSTTSSLSPVPINVLNDSLPYASESNRASTSNYTHRPSLSTGNPYTGSHAPSKHNFSRPLPPALESSQPFRPLCQAHMDSLPRGTRVIPPCDRCRRLRMDCVKNLTSCAGCTRKHARCHWRDVSREELGALDHMMDSAYPGTGGSPSHPTNGLNGDHHDESDDDESNPLEDLEALGEKEEQENQIREDEEGLRNAKELARQGWEDSLRDSQQTQAVGGQLVEAVGVHADTIESANAAAKAELAISSTVHGDAADRPAHSPDKEAEGTAPAPPPTDAAPMSPKMLHNPAVINGGFRAVNEVTSIGTTNGTGWRAI